MEKPIRFPAVAIAVAALFVSGAHSTSVQAQECVSQLRQQKLQMLRLAGECNVRADLIGSIDRGQRALPETECRRPIGVSGQLDSFTECARVYLCAAQSFNCAIRKASQGQDCIGASNACLQAYPVPQGRAAASGAGEAPPALDREAWRRVQSALAALGFDPGQPDGKLGPMTRRALQAWQQALGYAADGELTSGQVELLLAAAGLMLAASGPPDAAAAGAAGDPRREGETRDGKRHGRGTLTLADGGRYEGEIRDGREHGRGTATYASGDRYEGGWRDGKQHGRGTYNFANGNRYEGEWRNGKPHGRGTYISANGNRYEGEYRDGKPHGYGTFTLASGNRYEGEWRDGKEHGHGTYISANGNRYEGEYRDRKRHGHGTFTFANGNRYEGEWRDGKRHGQGTFTWASGNRYEGEYRDGKPHGYGTYTRTDGRVYQGQWREGCFGERGGRWATIGTGKEACGFG